MAIMVALILSSYVSGFNAAGGQFNPAAWFDRPDGFNAFLSSGGIAVLGVVLGLELVRGIAHWIQSMASGGDAGENIGETS